MEHVQKGMHYDGLLQLVDEFISLQRDGHVS